MDHILNLPIARWLIFGVKNLVFGQKYVFGLHFVSRASTVLSSSEHSYVV